MKRAQGPARREPTVGAARAPRLWRLWAACWAVLLVFGCARGGGKGSGKSPIILATTTSTEDSGLLGVLVPAFVSARGIEVKVVAVGSGEALAMGARGDADVLLVHSPAAEKELVAKGVVARRLPVMHNDFLLVGPPPDPAGAKGAAILPALRRIAETKSLFVSRGDRSGTHVKELALWNAAGLAVDDARWRLGTGQGMAETARVASEKRGYTLIDRATFLAQRRTLELVPIVEGDEALVNFYSVLLLDPTKLPKVESAGATAFAEWLVSTEGQKLIGEFGKDAYGEPLFVPDGPG